WFHNKGFSDAAAINQTFSILCAPQENDIVFRSSLPGGRTWTTQLPSMASASQVSIGAVAIHEFGHWIGFGHQNGASTTMQADYPSGGDISAQLRIHEDDHRGLKAWKPGPSLGR